jgi:hypothetical protein
MLESMTKFDAVLIMAIIVFWAISMCRIDFLIDRVKDLEAFQVDLEKAAQHVLDERR